jgi:hypothetical protein
MGVAGGQTEATATVPFEFLAGILSHSAVVLAQ